MNLTKLTQIGGSIMRKWQRYQGDVRGWFKTDGVTECSRDFIKAVVECNGTLTLEPNKTYNLGFVPTKTIKMLFDMKGKSFCLKGRNTNIIFACDTDQSKDGYGFLLTFKNIKSLTIDSGITFTDKNYDINKKASEGSRFGTFPVVVYSTTDSKSIINTYHNIDNALCHTYVLGIDNYDMIEEPVSRKPVKLLNSRGIIKSALYGVSDVYGCSGGSINLNCEDVRRGYISYGSTNMDIDINLTCSKGFRGSNAFVELACEGTTNPSNINIDVNVSGCEAHSSIVSFYHQGNNRAGSISNVKSCVRFSEFTQDGKDPTLSKLDVYTFRHENASEVRTHRKINNIEMEILTDGSKFSGEAFKSYKEAEGVAGSLKLGAFMSKYPLPPYLWKSFSINSFNEFTFEPTIKGTTSQGSATYKTRVGKVQMSGNSLTLILNISWRGHTGSGNLIIDNIPFKLYKDFSVMSTIRNTPIIALPTGDLHQLSVYTMPDNYNYNTLSLPVDGSIKITCSLPLS